MLKKISIGVATAIAGLFLLFLILLMTLAFCDNNTKINISSNLDQYVKDTDEYDDLIRLNRVSEFEDTLYYVHPESRKLYQYNGQDEDTLVCDNDMEYAAVYGESIYYVNENTLYEYSRETGEDKAIGIIDDKSWTKITIVDNKVFFINDEKILCSYDIATEEISLLTKRPVKRFRIYGDNIFYELEHQKGLYAMNLDGENSKRIIGSYFWDWDVHENHIFIVTESRTIFRIDLEENTYKVLVDDENAAPYYVKIVNGQLYYKVYNNPEDRLRQTDIDAQERYTIGAYFKDERCNVYKAGSNYAVLWDRICGDYITIYNDQDEKIQELPFEKAQIHRILTFNSNTIVIVKSRGNETYIIYDQDYNEIDRIPQSD